MNSERFHNFHPIPSSISRLRKPQRSSGTHPLAHSADSAPLVSDGNRPSLKNLFYLEGLEFIDNAYLTILGHLPDPGGSAFYLRMLLSGTSKAEIITRLAVSREGIRKIPGIRGIFMVITEAVLVRLPLVGKVFRTWIEMFRIDTRMQRLYWKQRQIDESLQNPNHNSARNYLP